MTTVRKPLIDSRDAPTAATTLYTVPVGVRATIDAAVATNTTGAAITLTVNLIPPGGTLGADNRLVSAASIAAGASYALPEIRLQDMSASSSINMVASATGLTIRVSGRETTTG